MEKGGGMREKGGNILGEWYVMDDNDLMWSDKRW